MSRINTQPTNSFPYSYNAPDGYVDTESEADPTDAGDDPLDYETASEYGTDRDGDVPDRQRRRVLDVDAARRVPVPLSQGQSPRETEFSEGDPGAGLNPVHRRFLDYNNVNDANFLLNSIKYLNLQQRILRSLNASEWKQRARCAIRAEDSLLARKFIQQAQLIKLSQASADRSGLTVPDFGWFIRKTYTQYLTFLVEAEAEGLLRGRRNKMLQPWAVFVQRSWGEDISATLLRAPYPLSSTYIRGGTQRGDVRQTPADRLRTSAPSLPRTQDSQTIQSSRNSRSSYTYVSAPLRGGNRGDEEETLIPPHASSHTHTRSDTIGPGSRYERTSTDHGGLTFRGRAQTDVPRSTPVMRPLPSHAASGGDPSRTPRRGTHDEVVETSEEEDDDFGEDGGRPDYGGGEDEDNIQNADGGQESTQPTTDRFGVRRGGQDYEHQTERANSRPIPRTIPPPNTNVQTRLIPNRGAIAPPITNRGQNLPSTNSRSPSSTVASTPITAQSSDILAGLSDLMKGFLAQRDYQDCKIFCESNPGIFDEDIKPLQGIAVHYLRHDQEDSARRVIERRLMLYYANSSTEKNIDYIKNLARTRSKQNGFQEQCNQWQEMLEDVIAEYSGPSSASSGGGTQRSNEPETNRPNAPRQVLNAGTTRPLRY